MAVTVAAPARQRQPSARITVIRRATAGGWREGLARLAEYRELLWALSVFRVRVRYKQSVLGLGWAILQPLALMAIYTLVFSLITQMPTGGRPYALFAYAALVPWTFFSSALVGATGSLVVNQAYVTKVYFPREIVPLTYIIASLFDSVVASTLLAAMLLFYAVPVTLNVLWVLPIMLLAFALATGIGLAASAFQVRVRDVGVAMPLLLQVWMFASPVVYPLEAVPARLQAWYDLNPMVGIVDGFRRAVLDGKPPEPMPLAFSAAVTAVVLLGGYAIFRRAQATMADII